VGGPIALLRDGDPIVIDAASHQINALLKQDVFDARRKEWTAPPLKVLITYIHTYANTQILIVFEQRQCWLMLCVANTLMPLLICS
jgi:dihydroxyacid dehydratase/phosphogluconate dehydratase